MNQNDRIIRLIQSGAITPQQADSLFSQAGVNVQSGEGGRTNFLNQDGAANARLQSLIDKSGFDGATSSGVMPANIEPLHQFEKNALNTLANPGQLGGGGMVDGQRMLRDIIANPTGAINQYTNPQATAMMNRAGGYYDKADQNTGLGAREVTSGEIAERLNAYTRSVVDTSIGELNESGERARAALLAKQRQLGSSSYGSTQSGIQLGDLTDTLFQEEGKIRANYGYQGYRDSVGDIQADRNRQLQAGQQYGGLGANATNSATAAQGISNSALSSAVGLPSELYQTGVQGTQVGFNAANNKLNAGSYIRNYNQGINDIISNDYLAEQNYPRQNIAATQSLLTPYQSQITQGGGTSGAGGSKAGNAIGAIASVAGSIFGSDKRLKQDVVLVGVKDGINIYDFNYLGGRTRCRGVLADEVKESHPDAVSVASNGFMMVDYAQLPVDFEVLNG